MNWSNASLVIEDQQREQARLKEWVEELEGRLALNSGNSNQPPSSDRFAKKTQSLRRPSGKPSGAQKEYSGRTLSFVTTPDWVMVHDPQQCWQCGSGLGAAAPTLSPERRQVFDLPPLRLEVTEHRVSVKDCPQCREKTVGAFPENVPSGASYGVGVRSLVLYWDKQHFIPSWRTCEIVQNLFGQPVSEGTLAAALHECTEGLAGLKKSSNERWRGRGSAILMRPG